MGASQPFLYSAERFPAAAFDPKAVTRASWAPKPARRQQSAWPLVALDRHAQRLAVSRPPQGRLPSGPRTKKRVERLRRLLLGLRVLQLGGAAGILALMAVLAVPDPAPEAPEAAPEAGPGPAATAWLLRIAPAVAAVHCAYALYHLARRASGRTPASSAAYQAFAASADLCLVSAYALGAVIAHAQLASWTTAVGNPQHLMPALVPAVCYTLVGAAGLHLVSLSLSLWLGLVFRGISILPPDLNPLEDHLTARPFGKSTGSLATTASSVEHAAARPSTLHGFQASPPPPGIPFLQTRAVRSYAALPQRCGFDDGPDPELGEMRPNPLGSHPPPSPPDAPGPQGSALSDTSSSERRVSRGKVATGGPVERLASGPRQSQRATRPVTVGGSRKVSSGNDHESRYSCSDSCSAHERPTAAGKRARQGAISLLH